MPSTAERQIAKVYAAAKGNRKRVRETAEREERQKKRKIGLKELAKAITASG